MTLMQKLRVLFSAREWRLFFFGQETVATEYEAMLVERSAAAQRRGLDVTIEALEYADKLVQQADRDEAKKAVIAAYKDGVVELARARTRILASATAEEVSEAFALPFGDASPSAIPSTNGSKAIEDATVGHDGECIPLPAQTRRGPGRPPGSKNRPKTGQGDGIADPPATSSP